MTLEPHTSKVNGLQEEGTKPRTQGLEEEFLNFAESFLQGRSPVLRVKNREHKINGPSEVSSFFLKSELEVFEVQ
jgi:hypothetical protein